MEAPASTTVRGTRAMKTDSTSRAQERRRELRKTVVDSRIISD